MKNFKKWCAENKCENLLELYENAPNKLKSDEVAFASSRIVNFKCKKCGTEWKEKLYRLTQRKKKECPYCNHQRLSKKYNLATEVPILVKEWNYELNLKQPTEYLPNSNKKVWWKCQNGHVWNDSIINRVEVVRKNINKERAICPYCNHKRISNNYNLLTEFPYVARQWDYIRNGSLTPLDVSPKSSKKVWWKCEYNSMHHWKDKIANRTLLYRNCPMCSKQFSYSFPARVLYYYLRQYFNDCEIEYKISNKYILDIFIPYYRIVIEYDGWYYHSNQQIKKRETEKDDFLKSLGLKIIRIKEEKKYLDKIIYANNIIKYYLKPYYKNLDELVEKVLKIIEKKINCNINLDIDFKRDYPKIENLYYHIRKSNSFAVKNPEMVKEWSSNNSISPDNITIGSGYKAKWICPKCNKEYIATIYSRIVENSNCPFCSNRKVCRENSLAEYSDRLVKEWNYEKNGDLLPENVPWSSSRKVWWKCSKGHEWEVQIYLRTGKHQLNCPYCSHERPSKEYNLITENPELNEIWDYELNLKPPTDYLPKSNKEVYWKCKNGHSWSSKIYNVQKMKSAEKCKYCKKISE